MKMKASILICFLILTFGMANAQDKFVSAGTNDTIKVSAIYYEGTLMPWIVLNEVIVFAKRSFKSKQDYDNYRRLRYNVLKVLPYARYAGQRYRNLERDLALTADKRKQKALVKGCEKEIKDLFNREVKNLTISQGEILIKLIDRETGNSSYSLVKDMKGGISAFLFQSVARVFGHDLKDKYDPDMEQDIESIIRSTGYYSYH